jgi:hypothetical protein
MFEHAPDPFGGGERVGTPGAASGGFQWLSSSQHNAAEVMPRL